MKLKNYEGAYVTPEFEVLSLLTEQPVLNGSFSNEDIGDEIIITWE